MILAKNITRALKKISADTLKVMGRSVVKLGNTYIVFGVYNVVDNDGAFVIYKNNVFVGETSYLSTALAWCVSNRANNVLLSMRLLQADNLLSNKIADIKSYNNMLSSPDTDTEVKAVIAMRLSQTTVSYKQAKQSLQNYIEKAKYIKIQGLINETT